MTNVTNVGGIAVHEPGDFWTTYFDADTGPRLIPQGDRWLLVRWK